MKLSAIVSAIAPPPELPAVGARVPAVAVRAVFAVTGVLLSIVDYGSSGWIIVGIALSVGAACAPQYLLGWVVILFLAAGELARHPGLSWSVLILLAGLHLLHVLAMLALELPWRSWVQPSVFVAPLQRFLVIQIPTQLLAIIALALLAPSADGHRPLTLAGFAVVGVVALAGVALLLIGPRLDEP
jgi:hypothetical protein